MAAGKRYASLGQRAIAIIVDSILVGIAIMAVSFIVLADALASGGATGSMILIPLVALLGTLYWFLLEGLWGVTLGKKLVGIKVVDEQGNVPGLVKSLIRNLLRIIDQLPTLYIIGIILIYTNDDNQRLGDMLADTYVVRS